jgi:hypothetical protein
VVFRHELLNLPGFLVRRVLIAARAASYCKYLWIVLQRCQFNHRWRRRRYVHCSPRRSPGAKTAKPPFGGFAQVVQIPRKSGAGEGIRTLDPDLGKVVCTGNTVEVTNLPRLLAEVRLPRSPYWTCGGSTSLLTAFRTAIIAARPLAPLWGCICATLFLLPLRTLPISPAEVRGLWYSRNIVQLTLHSTQFLLPTYCSQR